MSKVVFGKGLPLSNICQADNMAQLKARLLIKLRRLLKRRAVSSLCAAMPYMGTSAV